MLRAIRKKESGNKGQLKHRLKSAGKENKKKIKWEKKMFTGNSLTQTAIEVVVVDVAMRKR